MEEKLDWIKAEKYLKDYAEACKALIGMKQVNPIFVLAGVHRLQQRFNDGERSKHLYDEIMDLS